ncbi:MAG: hypothetical protein HYX83_02080 [Chloroflexi bacterium]|nr:hypothetical protein [Chloroflexota bacterium]
MSRLLPRPNWPETPSPGRRNRSGFISMPVVLEQVTPNQYNELPSWLNESLAMYNEGPMEIGFLNLLTGAMGEKSMLKSLSTLREDSACDGTLESVCGFDMVGFPINIRDMTQPRERRWAG